MEALYEKIKEYLNMDEEISAEEFRGYYDEVIAKLTADFDSMDDRALFQGKHITSVMASNAATRSKRRGADSKRFRKIQEKSQFWANAIDYRLKKTGYKESEIAQGVAALEQGAQGEPATPPETDALPELEAQAAIDAQEEA